MAAEGDRRRRKTLLTVLDSVFLLRGPSDHDNTRFCPPRTLSQQFCPAPAPGRGHIEWGSCAQRSFVVLFPVQSSRPFEGLSWRHQSCWRLPRPLGHSEHIPCITCLGACLGNVRPKVGHMQRKSGCLSDLPHRPGLVFCLLLNCNKNA